MTYRRHLLLFAATALTAASAYAAPVFMLQFGSFESQSEADAKLNALKTKHAGVLSRLDSGVREVTLPPDNLKVYRTQAGPLATRADAQSVCSQLASNGDECYVVETAMVQPALPAAQQTAAAPQIPAPVATPATDTAPAMSAPVVNAKTDSSTVISAPPVPAVAPPPVMASSNAMGADRDPSNIAAMNRVMPAPVVTADSTAQQPVSADATAEMDRELAAAAEKQNNARALSQPSPFAATAVGTSPATTATEIEEQKTVANISGNPQPEQKSRSLWDRLWGSDEEEAAPKKMAAAPQLEAAPIEPVTATDPMPSAPVMPALVAAPPPPASPPPPVVMAAPEPVRVVTDAPSYPLPPPPKPLKAQTQVAMEQAKPWTAPAPMPVAAQSNMPVAAPVITPTPLAAAPLQPAAGANVKVEEAKRVPLTQATTPPSSLPTYYPPAAPAVVPDNLRPSATNNMKTLWAEMGPFPNLQSALGYWNNYRRQHPDFPVVRTRVTSPLLAVTRGSTAVNLRVGPFAQQAFITNLCASTMTPQAPTQNYRCGSVIDLGKSSDPKLRRPGFLSDSRYRR